MSPRLTVDARAALDRAGLSRRRFIQGSGALLVAFAWDGAVGTTGEALAQGINGRSSPRLDSWIAVGEDGTVTAYTGKCEFGQGLYTAQMQLVAEELALPMERVRLVQCDTAVTPDQGTTSGQQSHPANFNNSNLALAAATAREALTRLASEQLSVAAAGLVVEDGVIRAATDASKRVTYAALLGGKRFDVPLDPRAQRKHPRPGRCWAQRCHAWTLPSSSPGTPSSSTPFACPACCMAGWCVPRLSVPRWRSATKPRWPPFPEWSRLWFAATSWASWPRKRGRPCKRLRG